MIKRYQSLPRWARLATEICFFVLLWFSIQAWMKKDMSRGPMPLVNAVDVRQNSPLNLPVESNMPYVVHFWASWCPICELMEESVVDIAVDYNVVGVALQSGSPDEVVAFMDEQEIYYPVISDPDGQISRQFGVNGVPATFIVDTDNSIRFIEKGFSTEWGIRLRLWYSSFSNLTRLNKEVTKPRKTYYGGLPTKTGYNN